MAYYTRQSAEQDAIDLWRIATNIQFMQPAYVMQNHETLRDVRDMLNDVLNEKQEAA